MNAITGNFDAGLSRVQGKLTKFTAGFADINGAVNVFKDALSIAASVAAYFGDQLERFHDLADMSHRLNVSAKSIQEFQRAIKLTGGDTEGLAGSLAILQRNLGKAAHGDGGAVEALQRLGLNAKVIASLGLDDAFKKIVSEISKIPTPAERAAVASTLFGKSASNLTGLLSDQGKAMREAARDIRQYGVEVDKNAKVIDRAVKAGEKAELAKQKAKSALAIASAPYLEKFYGGAEFLAASVAEIEFGKAFSDPMQFVKSYLFSAVNAEKRYQAARIPEGRSLSDLPPTGWQGKFANVDWEMLERGLNHIDRRDAGQPPPALQSPDWMVAHEQASVLRHSRQGVLDIGENGLSLNYKDMLNAIRVERPVNNFPRGGTAALEFGSAAAFSAIQQSRREDEALRIEKQQLEESKKTTKAVEQLLLEGIVLGSLELQG